MRCLLKSGPSTLRIARMQYDKACQYYLYNYLHRHKRTAARATVTIYTYKLTLQKLHTFPHKTFLVRAAHEPQVYFYPLGS